VGFRVFDIAESVPALVDAGTPFASQMSNISTRAMISKFRQEQQ